jgi:hypothetical protein
MRIVITRRDIIRVATPDSTFSMPVFPGQSYRVAVPEFTEYLDDYTLFILAGVGCVLLPHGSWHHHRPALSMN